MGAISQNVLYHQQLYIAHYQVSFYEVLPIKILHRFGQKHGRPTWFQYTWQVSASVNIARGPNAC